MNARGRQRMIAIGLGKPVKGVVGGPLYREIERERVCACVYSGGEGG